jgi:hypothetical protein
MSSMLQAAEKRCLLFTKMKISLYDSMKATTADPLLLPAKISS